MKMTRQQWIILSAILVVWMTSIVITLISMDRVQIIMLALASACAGWGLRWLKLDRDSSKYDKIISDLEGVLNRALEKRRNEPQE